jgi:hypothetical protein
MVATLEMIRTKFGGANAYLTKHTTLTKDDILKLRENLVVPPAQIVM